MMVVNRKYIVKEDIYLILGIIIFSLIVTLISFEYGVATFIAMLTTGVYYLVFEKSIESLLTEGNSKLSVISMYIVGLLRYVCIGGGVIAIFFLFSSFSIRLYAIILIVIVWFVCIGIRNRR